LAYLFAAVATDELRTIHGHPRQESSELVVDFLSVAVDTDKIFAGLESLLFDVTEVLFAPDNWQL